MSLIRRLQGVESAIAHPMSRPSAARPARRAWTCAGLLLALAGCFAVEARAAQVYPFTDDMENIASGNWLADAPWASYTGDSHSGARSWTDSPGGYYANSTDVSLVSSFSLNLSGAVHPVLRFWHHYDLEPGYDFGRVEVSTNNGASWTTVKQFSGTEAAPVAASLIGTPKPPQDEKLVASLQSYPNWTLEQLDLTAYAGQSLVMFRFRLTSDASVQRDGWYVDDVVLAERLTPVTLAAVANPTPTSLDLSWSQNADAGFARYEVYRSSTPTADFGKTLVTTITDRTATSFTDVALASKSTYTYIVYAVSSLGTYAGSNLQAGTTLAGLTYPFRDNVEAGANWFSTVPNTWRRITPDVAHSGTKIWTASQAGSYGNNWNSALEIASPLTLTGSSALVFWERIGLLDGDIAYVETSVDDGATWQQRRAVTNTTESGWTRVQLDLAGIVGACRIRFRIATDETGTGTGWDLDDITVSDAPAPLTLATPDGSSGPGSLHLDWSTSTSPFFREYQLYRSTDPTMTTGTTLRFQQTDPAQHGYADLNLSPGTTYYYKLVEATTFDVQVASNIVSATPSGSGYPFYDSMENSNGNWVAENSWARSSEFAHSGTMSWTDSPNTSYGSGANSALKITLPLVGPVQPYLSFWSRRNLGTSSQCLIEITTDAYNWAPLATLTGVQDAWRETRIDLSDWRTYTGLGVRFRMEANGSVGDGWYIDDVTVGENPGGALAFPFTEDAENETQSLARWDTGSWKITNPGRSGNGRWSSTLNGTYDPVTGWHYSETRLSTSGLLDLRAVSAPQLVFFYQGSFNYPGTSLYAEVQPEGGVWTYLWSTGSPPSTWTRQQLDLSPYIGTRVRLRFHHYFFPPASASYTSTFALDDIAITDAPANVTLGAPSGVGKHSMALSWTASTDPSFLRYELRRWTTPGVSGGDVVAASLPAIGTTSFVDSGLLLNQNYYYRVYVVRQEGTSEVVGSGSNEVSARTLQAPYPLTENAEGSLANWDLQGGWEATAVSAHGGLRSLTDSPGLPYDASANSSATTSLSLGSTVQPYLSFWQRHSLGSSSQCFVELSTDGTNWQALSTMTGFQDAWRETRIDLSDWRSVANVWIRFRLMGNGTVGEGWYVDDVTIGENTALALSYPFYDGAENESQSMARWHAGSWRVVSPAQAPTGSWASTLTGVYDPSYGGYRASEARLSMSGLLDLRTATSPQLVFFYQSSYNYPGLTFYVEVQPEGGAWTYLWASSNPPSTWNRQQLDLSAYAGARVRIRFRHYFYGQYYGYFSTLTVDEITVTGAPANVTVNAPSAIGKHGMTLSWTASTDPTFLRYELRRRSASGVGIGDALVASLSAPGSTAFVDNGLSLDQNYYYRVFVVRQEGTSEVASSGSNEVTARTLQAPYPLAEDAEGSLVNWDLQGGWGATQVSAHGGTHSLTDSPSLPYDANIISSATTALSLGSTVQPQLGFWERHSLGSNSRCLVELSTDGVSWSTIATMSGFQDTWHQSRLDLSEWRSAANVWIRFRLLGNGTAGEGWYVDDVSVAENTSPLVSYPFYDGAENEAQSMATWLSGSWRVASPGQSGSGRWTSTLWGGIYDPGGSYRSSSTRMTMSGLLDLRAATAPQLAFYFQGSATNFNSALYAEIQPEGGAWTYLWAIGTPPGTWTRQQLDLSAYAGARVRVRFLHNFFSSYFGDFSTVSVDEISVSSNPSGAGIIAVGPVELQFNVHPDALQTQNLTITNTGAGTLNFNIQEATGAAVIAAGSEVAARTGTGGEGDGASEPVAPGTLTAADATDVSWLSELPTSGQIAPGEQQVIAVSAQAPATEGTSVAYLVISSNDPVRSLVAVPVTMVSSNLFLVGPVPGDTLQAHQLVPLQWDSAPGVSLSSVDLDLSTDAGRTFTRSIATAYTGSAPLNWDVPAVASDSCVVRIRAHVTGNGTLEAKTSGVFTIQSQGSVDTDGPQAPILSLLRSAHPNPSTGASRIRYDVASPGMPVRISIYDIRGRLVRIVDEGWASPGRAETEWNGLTDAGERVRPGVYFCLMTSGSRTLGKLRLIVLH